jgi:hypothetical protein
MLFCNLFERRLLTVNFQNIATLHLNGKNPPFFGLLQPNFIDRIARPSRKNVGADSAEHILLHALWEIPW